MGVGLFSLHTIHSLLGRLIILLGCLDNYRGHLLVKDFAAFLKGQSFGGNKFRHLFLDNRHLQNLRNRRSFLGVLLKQHVDQLPNLAAVGRTCGQWCGIVSHNLKHETKQVVSFEGLLKRAQFIKDTTKGPNI